MFKIASDLLQCLTNVPSSMLVDANVRSSFPAITQPHCVTVWYKGHLRILCSHRVSKEMPFKVHYVQVGIRISFIILVERGLN